MSNTSSAATRAPEIVRWGENRTAGSGQTLSNLRVWGGGVVTISSGGSGNDISAVRWDGNEGGGKVYVNGGKVTNITVSGNGTRDVKQGSLVVRWGGTSRDATVDGGYMTVQGYGAYSENTFVTHSGWQDVGSNNNGSSGGGIAKSTTLISGGAQYVRDGGTAVETAISAGGSQILAAGGKSVSATIFAGAYQAVGWHASAYDTNVHDGGALRLAGGGYVQGGTVYRGGSLSAEAHGILGGNINIAGVLTGGTYSTNGVATVTSGGTIKNVYFRSGSTAVIQAGGSIVGGVNLAAGAQGILDVGAGGTINLGGAGYSKLTITGTGNPTTKIMGFNGASASQSDQITLQDVPKSDIIGINYPDADHIQFMLKDGSSIIMNIPGVKNFGYSLEDDGNGSTRFAVCFLSGTLIETPIGDKFIEDLVIGDEVYTYRDGIAIVSIIKWIGKRNVSISDTKHFTAEDFPVRICAGAISENIPENDLFITPEHCVYIDGYLIPARMLVNGGSIVHDESIKHFTYHHIEFERHSLIRANRLLTESYFDTGNRNTFENISKNIAKNYSDRAAPLNVEREFVEKIWRRLAKKSNITTFKKYDRNRKEVTIETQSGHSFKANRVSGNIHVFLIPSDEELVYIHSEVDNPSKTIGPFVDDRRSLGVLVGEVLVFDGLITKKICVNSFLVHARGWHSCEAGSYRWTSGRAVLPLGKSEAPPGHRVLSIEIAS